MARTGAIEVTLRRAADYAEQAKASLAPFAPSGLKRGLVAVADYTVQRGR
jgi:geranylgeranyl pyrophosphate synthase